jgi:alkylation response protein AidB-like acyl-CoA dehydrogenase
MSPAHLKQRLNSICRERLPCPGTGSTAQRHRRLMEVAREDVSLARLAEAHWDAIAILDEARRRPQPGALYGVWASEVPGKPLLVETCGPDYHLSGSKMFCSGAGLVDRALVTVGIPGYSLLDLDLQSAACCVEIDLSPWNTDAFRSTQTGTVTFHSLPVPKHSSVGEPGWYLDRPGFWHGACGPAACWAGGVAGLLDFAMDSPRRDPHTLAHLAALYANVWALESFLDQAGREIDSCPSDSTAARIRALAVRHLVERLCTDTLQRFARAYGPAPLCMNQEVSRRYHECDLYLRQSHAERDLERLGSILRAPYKCP